MAPTVAICDSAATGIQEDGGVILKLLFELPILWEVFCVFPFPSVPIPVCPYVTECPDTVIPPDIIEPEPSAEYPPDIFVKYTYSFSLIVVVS